MIRNSLAIIFLDLEVNYNPAQLHWFYIISPTPLRKYPIISAPRINPSLSCTWAIFRSANKLVLSFMFYFVISLYNAVLYLYHYLLQHNQIIHNRISKSSPTNFASGLVIDLFFCQLS